MLIHCSKIPNKKKSELRKKASDFAFAIYDSVSMINTEHWNSIVKYGSEFLNLPFLTVIENQHPSNMHFHYAIIYDNTKPVAISYFQVVDFSSESFGSFLEPDKSDYSCIITDYLKKHITNHIIKSADRINLRLLICGNAYVSGEHGFTCIPETNKTEAIDAIADVIYRISRAEKLRGKIAAVLVKDFYSDSIKHTKEFEEYKYHDFLVEPNMMIDIQWKTFDDYLNAMSKKYRNRAKNVVKKGAEIERKNFSSEEILANEKEIQKLYNNVHLKAKFRMASLTSAYFAEMKKVLGDKFSFVGYYYNQKLIGFKSTFILEHEIEAHFIGLDYSLNKDLDVYQNILYDYVKEAIENSSKKLLLGRTASEIKSTLGAEALELTCYIRHRNPLSNRIIKPFVDFLKPSEWIPRNPFKEISI
jgi:predicted N-acyltransferase